MVLGHAGSIVKFHSFRWIWPIAADGIHNDDAETFALGILYFGDHEN